MKPSSTTPTNYSEVAVRGTHFCVDMMGCDAGLIDDEENLKYILLQAAEKASATVLGIQSYKFTPHGVTIVLLLAESHMSIHTWPERSYAAIDVFTCGQSMSSEKAIEYIKSRIGATSARTAVLDRGE